MVKIISQNHNNNNKTHNARNLPSTPHRGSEEFVVKKFRKIHSVILLTLKDGNTIASLYLCHFFYMLIMLMISDYACRRVHLYTIVKGTDGKILKVSVFAVGCYLCSLSLARCVHY